MTDTMQDVQAALDATEDHSDAWYEGWEAHRRLMYMSDLEGDARGGMVIAGYGVVMLFAGALGFVVGWIARFWIVG